ncbi:MAG: ribosomal protein S18-alanine N-acetyltransferase [Hyphomicrobium sp.]|nr:ribosomal protein S18-alanine N-acetyltransferase [Hyphomicrobium sp.]
MNSNVTPFRNIKHVSMLWAAPERAGEIAALHKRLFSPAWDEASVLNLLEHPASTSLVAVAGDPKQLAGFVIGQLAADEAEILSIGVAPDWQRTGLGKMLVQGLARASKRGEAKRLFLEVAEDNVAAQALYSSLGFTEAGRRKRYYERPGATPVDALVLALIL